MQLLILSLPFLMSIVVIGVGFVFSPARFSFSRALAVALPGLALAIEVVLIWQPTANSPDGSFGFTPLDQLFLTFLFALTLAALGGAYTTGNLNSGRFSPVVLAVSGAIIAALYIHNIFLQTLFFVLAGFFSIVAVVDVGTDDEERFVRAIKAAVRYLIATVLFGLIFFIALVFLERLRVDPQLIGLIKVVVALTVVGIATRLAIFPFNLWLPEIAEIAPGLANFLVMGLINGATVVFLVDFLQNNPALLLDNYPVAQPMMIFGLAGGCAAGLLALGQNEFGKMLAYIVSADFGLILFGLASPHRTGLNGALFEAANLALMQVLIYTSLSVVSYCTEGKSPNGLSGLGRRMPIATLGLAVGLMGMVGLPFFSGFVGKYLLLQSAAQEGLVWVLAGGLTLFFMLIASFSYFHRIFMGNDVPGLKTLPEPRGARVIIVGLIAVVLLVGIWPAALLNWIDSALRAAF